MNKRDYWRRWQQVPHQTAPPDLREKIIKKSGILNSASQPRSYPQWVYLCANLVTVLAIFLLISFDLHRPDHNARERFFANTACIAERASLTLQYTIYEIERQEVK